MKVLLLALIPAVLASAQEQTQPKYVQKLVEVKNADADRVARLVNVPGLTTTPTPRCM